MPDTIEKLGNSLIQHGPENERIYLMKINGEEVIHPAILDRVWQGMDRVRPAGVKLKLAVEEQIVRGD